MKIVFSSANKDFSMALNKAIGEYFSVADGKMTGNKVIYIKTGILLSSLFILYFILLFATMPGWLSLLLCALLGFNLAAIGFNVMHDAGHGSYSQIKWLNYMMALSLNLMGGSIYFWKEKHNISHHSYTNIEGHDEDIDIKPWIRTNANQPRYWYHKYQHYYWPLFYSLTYLAWIFYQDFQKYFSGKIGERVMKPMDKKEHFIFWGSKLFYVFVFIVLPVIIVGWKAVTGYLVAAMVCGFVISVVFQLAHVVEHANFPKVEPQTVYADWSIHQVTTTADFSTHNKVLTWLLGGLNFQVEHHLFPKISHVHYPKINEIVKQICRRFNVSYMEFSSIFKAIKSHISYLKSMGQKES